MTLSDMDSHYMLITMFHHKSHLSLSRKTSYNAFIGKLIMSMENSKIPCTWHANGVYWRAYEYESHANFNLQSNSISISERIF